MSDAAVDPRAPVIVGAGQVTIDGSDAPEPVDLLCEAARRAGTDSGAPGVVGAVQSVQVVRIVSWRYRDPGALVAQRLGLGAVHTVSTTNGGQTPQALVNRAAEAIRDGRLDMALIGGAESFRTLSAYRARGETPPWTVQGDDVEPAQTVGAELRMVNATEAGLGLRDPVQMYPLFESALRARSQIPPAQYRRRIAELWASFSEVAAHNPAAAIRRAVPADEILTATASNRMIGYPYTKFMTSNPSVNQAAAVVVCSVQRARELGVPMDRWVFLHAAAEASEVPFLSNRADLASSVAARMCGRALFGRAGASIDDVAHLDVYSCFPSAVQVVARELGIGPGRQLTVTGGLTFAGGPWNNYVSHSLATMAGVLREDPGSLGLVTANGGALGKQALGLYSTRPPRRRLVVDRPQREVDGLARRALIADYRGPGVLEAATVVHDRQGVPQRAFALCGVERGARAWAVSTDATVMDTLMSEAREGTAVDIGESSALQL